MSEYILDVVSQKSKLDWAFPFQRTGAFPIDRSSLFSSYEDAVLYASGNSNDSRKLGGSSYVGQPISVYNAESNDVTLYVIQPNRSLKEVGTAPVGDNLSIEVIDNEIQLKNFGTGYYKYIAAEKDENGEIKTPSSYEYVTGFIAGLEPRVVNNNGNLEIAWYEPSEETIEGIGAKVATLEKTVESLTLDIGQASDADKGQTASGIHAVLEDLNASKADKSDVYTKTETDDAIATAVVNAAHLRRKIVSSILDIDKDADDAHLYIYMVPTGLQEDDDKYDEYIIIEGALEKVGSWEIDLSNYATKELLKETDDKVEALSKTVSEEVEELDEKLLNLQTDLENEVKRATAAEAANAKNLENKADKATTLAGYGITDTYTKNEITDLISDITGGESAADVKAELIQFKSDTSNALQAINGQLNDLIGAEPNYIQAVDSANFAVSNEGLLTLVSIDPSQVSGLQEILNTGTSLVTEEEKAALQNILTGKFNNFISSVSTDFNVTDDGKLQLVNVQNSAILHIVGDMNELTNYYDGITLVDEINDIRALLAWQEMENM